MTDIELSFNILLELQTVGHHLERPSEENRMRKTEYQENASAELTQSGKWRAGARVSPACNSNHASTM